MDKRKIPFWQTLCLIFLATKTSKFPTYYPSICQTNSMSTRLGNVCQHCLATGESRTCRIEDWNFYYPPSLPTKKMQNTCVSLTPKIYTVQSEVKKLCKLVHLWSPPHKSWVMEEDAGETRGLQRFLRKIWQPSGRQPKRDSCFEFFRPHPPLKWVERPIWVTILLSLLSWTAPDPTPLPWAS